jgi:pyridinium-3,5-biscarboxylic acid mononucleotide synthase
MRDVLRRLVAGEITEDEALSEIRTVQLDELSGRAKLDLGRYLRRGVPEVVLATGKSPGEAARLVVAMAERQGQGLISRMTEAHESAVREAAAVAGLKVAARTASARVMRAGFASEPSGGKVGILTAGTSDVPVADEARMFVEACGLEARLEADLGVAGLHRFVGPLAAMLEWGADVIVVAAGMDGVLPGLVAGLTDVPVIGLPVSTGYGRGGAGEAALTTMLQSCSTGLVVVNIDNGVGAGAAAAQIATRAAQGRRRRGRTTAASAPASATISSTPSSRGAIIRQASAPPGMAKVRASTRTATHRPASSQGKPRRRRP